MLWKFFHHLSKHNSCADLDVVLDFLKDQIAVKKEFLIIAGVAKSEELLQNDDAKDSDTPKTEVASTVEVSMPATLAHTDLLAEVEALSAHFQRILLDPQVRHRLEWLQPSPLSLRAFLCLSFWSLTPTNIECILAWGKAFRAAEVLKDLLSTEAVLVSDDEIDVLFANIDIDSSGDLTISELVLAGHLTKSQAEQLFDKCRRKNDAALSDKDLRSYVRSLCQAPGKDMKGVLTTFAHSPHASPHHSPEPEPECLPKDPK